MDKIFDLLDVAIAIILLVVALTVQIHSNYRISQGYRLAGREELAKVQKIQNTSQNLTVQKLCYFGNGLECLSYLAFINQDKEDSYLYGEEEYNYQDFCKQVFNVESKPELNYIFLEDAEEKRLLTRWFKIYQQKGKWRIEEI